jgi:hypothetical protein
MHRVATLKGCAEAACVDLTMNAVTAPMTSRNTEGLRRLPEQMLD